MINQNITPEYIKNIRKNADIDNNKSDHFFYGHGKLLLTGEYFVLDGAKSLALPTTVGQSLNVKYSPSFSPKLYWKSYDVASNLWFESVFEFWRFEIISDDPRPEEFVLQNILRQARKQNPHFLRDNVDVHVETNLGFPMEWGLGSSSTLVHNMAQWAYVSPFELLFNTYGGSGYDVACAQSEGPIFYSKNSHGPKWSPTVFNPSFKDNLYFVYRGKKQDSRKAIEYYNSLRPIDNGIILSISDITEEISTTTSLKEFEFLIGAHEKIVAQTLDLRPVKDELFSNYWGEVKSLGAWGGDFLLVTSDRSPEETKKYFFNKGHDVFIPYEDLILGAIGDETKNELFH
ncbi:GYDIA family GHMP kinase [Halobacteriovorax sp. HLS]|uniref:GYDIA family GHMP kinase n=1 Tax=Halobacteriovorax sp. HLS TaxID=2234000 RepID=UPI000FD9BCB5|nr:GYDIA family GHMP kinase [Halobacteriovorax sp. HLS]